MHTTRVFKNGNSQAVRIPADLAFERTDIELEIERIGDELRIRPARRSLAGVMAKFACFSPGFISSSHGTSCKCAGLLSSATSASTFTGAGIASAPGFFDLSAMQYKHCDDKI